MIILMRGQKLTTPQIWHRDEIQETGGMFVICPLTKDYHIYVIPGSHNIPQGENVVSTSAIKLTLQPGQLFLGVSSLVHAGGEVNTTSVGILLILKNNMKCYDIALHAYAVKGVHSSAVMDKSEETITVSVVPHKKKKQ
jgi:hypothetical protein